MNKQTKIGLGMLVGGTTLAAISNSHFANKAYDAMSLYKAINPYTVENIVRSAGTSVGLIGGGVAVYSIAKGLVKKVFGEESRIPKAAGFLALGSIAAGFADTNTAYSIYDNLNFLQSFNLTDVVNTVKGIGYGVGIASIVVPSVLAIKDGVKKLVKKDSHC